MFTQILQYTSTLHVSLVSMWFYPIHNIIWITCESLLIRKRNSKFVQNWLKKNLVSIFITWKQKVKK